MYVCMYTYIYIFIYTEFTVKIARYEVSSNAAYIFLCGLLFHNISYAMITQNETTKLYPQGPFKLDIMSRYDSLSRV